MDVNSDLDLLLRLCIQHIMALWSELEVLRERIVELECRMDVNQLLLGEEELLLGELISEEDRENVVEEEFVLIDQSDHINSFGNIEGI